MKKKQHHGTNRQHRLLHAFSPEKAPIDDRDIDRFLAFASDFSTLVNFYNTDNQPEGDWSVFFRENPIVALAVIAHTPVNLKQQRYSDATGFLKKENAKKDPHREAQQAVAEDVFQMAYELAEKINAWYLIFSTPDTVYSSFREEIRNAITQTLQEGISALKQFDALYHPQSPALFEKFDPELWHYTPLTDEQGQANEKHLLEKLADSLWHFNRSTVYLSNLAQKEIKKHLADHTTHPPHLALFITFLKLFGHSQGLLNDITRRHLNFYYRKVLHTHHLPASGDSVHTLFDLAPGNNEFFLPQGTRLAAGKDASGNPVEYVTTEDSLLNQASISSLKTLYLASNPLIYPVGTQKLITGIYVAQQANSPKGMTAPVTPEEMPDGWPVFGEDQSMYSTEERTMGDGRIGFAISSPVLQLSEGERHIRIRITFIAYSWLMFIQKIQEKYGDLIKFYQKLPHTFTLTASGEKGWIPLPIQLIRFEGETQSLVIEVRLSQEEPALTGFNPKLHPGRYSGTDPVLQLCLNTDTPFYGYSFLENLAVRNIDIQVEASGIRNVLLFNQNGPVNTSKPFEPFGPIPQKGAYLAIGYPEAVRKDLSSLSVDVKWFGLPPEGFCDYYSNYGQAFSNDIFKVRLSMLRGGKWLPNETLQPVFPLFHSIDPEQNCGSLQPDTRLGPLKPETLLFRPYSDSEAPLVPLPGSLNGFLRLELFTPSYTFGQELYPEAISSIMLENARNKKEEKKLPHKPYVPVAESVTLQYSAEAKADFSINSTGNNAQILFFHLTPFSEYEVFADRNAQDLPELKEDALPFLRVLPKGTVEAARKEYEREIRSLKFLLPLYASKRYLFIGLNNLPVPGSLNLLFQLIPNPGIKTQPWLPQLKWTYLSHNEWKEFGSGNQPVDDTLGLIRPGIIRFTIPSDISFDHTVMPSGVYWIRAEATSDTTLLSRVLSVNTQAVKASRILTPGNAVQYLLDPGSIKSLSQPIPQIKKVSQPYRSFGGTPAEDITAFYARISERLRHKKRAITCWDYERLVLQAFPSVYMACCLPVYDLKKENPGTNVMLVVIPTPETAAQSNTSEPKVSYNTLEEIKKYITAYTSPFVSVEVRNPTYDRLKVMCQVKFQSGKNGNLFVQQLNTDICNFLSPWLETPGKGQQIGGSLSRSAILNFIEKRPYVDYVTAFSVLQLICNDDTYDLKDSALPGQDEDLIEGSTPWTVLSTAPQHSIRSIDEEVYAPPKETGIDMLQIGEDFVLTDPKPLSSLSTPAPPRGSINTERSGYFIVKSIPN